jgi:hypothetical protein
MMEYMSSDIVKNKKLWVPQRTYGVCVWIGEDGKPLTDGDGVLCAEGVVGDTAVEKRVADAANYWTGGTKGYTAWIAGGRKVSASERDDQSERFRNGLVADPYEDFFDGYFNKRG